jgi:hypothetical protein
MIDQTVNEFTQTFCAAVPAYARETCVPVMVPPSCTHVSGLRGAYNRDRKAVSCLSSAAPAGTRARTARGHGGAGGYERVRPDGRDRDRSTRMASHNADRTGRTRATRAVVSAGDRDETD